MNKCLQVNKCSNDLRCGTVRNGQQSASFEIKCYQQVQRSLKSWNYISPGKFPRDRSTGLKCQSSCKFYLCKMSYISRVFVLSALTICTYFECLNFEMNGRGFVFCVLWGLKFSTLMAFHWQYWQFATFKIVILCALTELLFIIVEIIIMKILVGEINKIEF